MPAPAAEGAGNGAQGLSAAMKWLCDHIRWSLNADEDKIKRLLSSDSRFCLRVTTLVSYYGPSRGPEYQVIRMRGRRMKFPLVS